MIKKKSARNEETENHSEGEVTDSKEVNSHEESSADVNPESGQTTGQTDTPVREAAADSETLVKLAEMQDRYLRLSAEFDNYRKRTLREKIELTKHAGESMLVNIVPVMDDFERAIKSMENSTDIVAIKAGIDLIYSKFNDFLTQNGLREIEALKCDFNVDLHDAVSKAPAPDESLRGKVLEVVQKGYYLHDKVMRHSKVVVGE